MASVQDLKRRIHSVRNTRKITRAMELDRFLKSFNIEEEKGLGGS